MAPLGAAACTGLDETAFVETAFAEKACAGCGSDFGAPGVADSVGVGALHTAAISGNVT
jgi:hypothetical protein